MQWGVQVTQQAVTNILEVRALSSDVAMYAFVDMDDGFRRIFIKAAHPFQKCRFLVRDQKIPPLI